MKILLPRPFGSDDHRASPVRPTGSTTLRVALVDNGKPGASGILDAVGEALVAAGVAGSWFRWRKPSMAATMTEAELAAIVADSTLVVAGVGDCGACTSCTVMDAVLAEQAGVPATVVVTDRFSGLARSVYEMQGVRDGPLSVVAHPIGSQQAAWLAEQGRAIAASVAASLLVEEPGTHPEGATNAS